MSRFKAVGSWTIDMDAIVGVQVETRKDAVVSAKILLNGGNSIDLSDDPAKSFVETFELEHKVQCGRRPRD